MSSQTTPVRYTRGNSATILDAMTEPFEPNGKFVHVGPTFLMVDQVPLLLESKVTDTKYMRLHLSPEHFLPHSRDATWPTTVRIGTESRDKPTFEQSSAILFREFERIKVRVVPPKPCLLRIDLTKTENPELKGPRFFLSHRIKRGDSSGIEILTPAPVMPRRVPEETPQIHDRAIEPIQPRRLSA